MGRKIRSMITPVLMLAIGVAAGWWLAQSGLQRWLPRHGAPPAPSGAVHGGAGEGDIHRVDFRNFSYAPDCLRTDNGGQANVRVHDGEFTRNAGMDRLYFSVPSVSYGDLTGDGADEAVVLTSCNTGGSGVFTEGLVYTMQAGQPMELARIEPGSAAFGGIVSLQVERGLLVVERYATDEAGAHCCPKYIDTTRHRWDGHALTQVGGVERRNVPAE